MSLTTFLQEPVHRLLLEAGDYYFMRDSNFDWVELDILERWSVNVL